MTYATQADLVARFGEAEIRQLTDRALPPLGEIDAAAVAKALSDAEQVINGYVSARYALPLATVHPLLEKIACDLARGYLYGDAQSGQVKDNAALAMKMLEAIASGKMSLGLNTVNAPTVAIAGPDYVAPEPVFSRDTLADFAGSN